MLLMMYLFLNQMKKSYTVYGNLENNIMIYSSRDLSSEKLGLYVRALFTVSRSKY